MRGEATKKTHRLDSLGGPKYRRKLASDDLAGDAGPQQRFGGVKELAELGLLACTVRQQDSNNNQGQQLGIHEWKWNDGSATDRPRANEPSSSSLICGTAATPAVDGE